MAYGHFRNVCTTAKWEGFFVRKCEWWKCSRLFGPRKSRRLHGAQRVFFVSSAKVEESGLFCVDSSAVKTSTAAPPESNNKGDAVFVNDVSEIQSPYLNYAIMFQVIEHIANTTNQINHM